MNARLVAEKLAWQTTRRIAIRWGEALPFTYVSEYPKSGGAWLAAMLADYLELPFPRHAVLPVAYECVIQNHWRHHPRLHRVLYLHRDGRDVMISLYFHRLRIARHSDRPGRARTRRIYEGLFGRGYDPADVARHLPRFLEFELTRPGRGTPLAWPEHVADWVQPGREDRVRVVSYESLSRDCAGTLGGALEWLAGEAADPWRLQATVDKLSMLSQTGRRPGQTDPRHFVRKGIVGDWRNHFSREAAEIFDQLAGETLIRLGYERDQGWVERYEYATV